MVILDSHNYCNPTLVQLCGRQEHFHNNTIMLFSELKGFSH